MGCVARTRASLVLVLTALLGLLPTTALGQRASNWQAYRLADGFPESACTSVGTGPQGRVLVRHPRNPAVSELDGYSITNLNLDARGNGRLYGSVGGRIWTLVPEGILEFTHGDWELHPVPEIAAEFQAGRLRPFEALPGNRLWPLRQGLLLVLLSDRLLEVNCESPESSHVTVLRTAHDTGLEHFISMGAARDGGLWISGERGVAKLLGPARTVKPDSPWQEHPLPASIQVHNIGEPHEQSEGHLTAVAETLNGSGRVVVHLDGDTWTVESIGAENLRQAWRGPDNTCWAMTGHALFEWEEGTAQAVENEEISARQYYDVAVEPGGTFWLATSEGLFHYAPPLWRTPHVAQKFTTLVPCLTAATEGGLWMVSGGALHWLRDQKFAEYPFPADSPLRSLAVRALFALQDGSCMLAGESQAEKDDAGERLFTFQSANRAFRPLTLPGGEQPVRALGALKDGGVCLQIASPRGADSYQLVRYDGRSVSPLPCPAPPATLGLSLSTCFTAQNGDVWLSGERGTGWYHDNRWRMYAATDDSMPSGALGFVELSDGRTWCATRELVWEFDGRTWSVVLHGLDRINALTRTHDGSVWVASNGGLHRYFKGGWVEHGLPEGLGASSVRALGEDSHGQLWAGTTRGVSLYHPEADQEPPHTAVQNLIGDSLPEGSMLTLAFSGLDRWKFTPTERLLFSYRLDERDWTVFHEASGVSFSELPAGKHYFQVRAMDRNGNVDPKPARCEFAYILPWYKEARLVLIASSGVGAALFFAFLAFNRHRRLLRSYAEVEKKVAERTRELELASRELMHSQKMTALGTLAAGIAHDFNNILSIIKGSVQIIEDNLAQPEKVRTRLERINTVVEQGSGIVKAMLGFSRDSSTQPPGPCAPNTVTADTIKLLGDRFLREVQVTFKPEPRLPSVVASKDFVQQILLNLIFNAAESMPKRKEIVLTTRRLERLQAELVLPPAAAREYVAISVQDFGCGIAPSIMPRIFEPFFTTKALSARRGTGLGLSMVYELAKKLEAGLAVQSVVDQGSTFTVILPVWEAPPGPESPLGGAQPGKTDGL